MGFGQSIEIQFGIRVAPRGSKGTEGRARGGGWGGGGGGDWAGGDNG